MNRFVTLLTFCVAVAILRVVVVALIAALALALVWSFITRPRETLVLLGTLALMGLADARPVAFIVTLGVVAIVGRERGIGAHLHPRAALGSGGLVHGVIHRPIISQTPDRGGQETRAGVWVDGMPRGVPTRTMGSGTTPGFQASASPAGHTSARRRPSRVRRRSGDRRDGEGITRYPASRVRPATGPSCALRPTVTRQRSCSIATTRSPNGRSFRCAASMFSNWCHALTGPAAPIVVGLEVLGASFFVAQAVGTFLLLRLHYELRWYKVTDRSLRIRAGVVFVNEMTVTFANVQDITITQGGLRSRPAVRHGGRQASRVGVETKCRRHSTPVRGAAA